jgi:hypothetical protein
MGHPARLKLAGCLRGVRFKETIFDYESGSIYAERHPEPRKI